MGHRGVRTLFVGLDSGRRLARRSVRAAQAVCDRHRDLCGRIDRLRGSADDPRADCGARDSRRRRRARRAGIAGADQRDVLGRRTRESDRHVVGVRVAHGRGRTGDRRLPRANGVVALGVPDQRAAGGRRSRDCNPARAGEPLREGRARDRLGRRAARDARSRLARLRLDSRAARRRARGRRRRDRGWGRSCSRCSSPSNGARRTR